MSRTVRLTIHCALTLVLLSAAFTCQAEPAPDSAQVTLRWGVKIPMRDGVELSSTSYTPKDQPAPAPCIFMLTPYTTDDSHDRGVYFAAHGLPFLIVDARGRGNSGGEFRPFEQEAQDGYDVAEWLARQPWCNGKISMWGGSYAGYAQWATAKEFPPHLSTIVPVASPYRGWDTPIPHNIRYASVMQWFSFVQGRALQLKLYNDSHFWTAAYRDWFESGTPFKQFDERVGIPSRVFQEQVAHPQPDAYWDSMNPTAEQFAKLQIPVLTITGSYDGDQLGALKYYQEQALHGSPAAKEKHYLVIGPWSHGGTRTPRAEVEGLKFGPASLVDLPKLHAEWYAWTMQGGPKPAFLQKQVAYYVMGAEKWRYADTLDAVTERHVPYFLDSATNASDVMAAGRLQTGAEGRGKPDHYVYDPRDVSSAQIESVPDVPELTDQRLVYANSGKQVVYHTAPFEKDTEISGFFKLSAWLAIDQPDTDFRVSVYEILADGSSVALTESAIRARYREGLRTARLIATREPLRYDFDQFSFVSREVRQGSRLRVVIGPMNSMYSEKNYNSGGVVAEESMKDARTVTVRLFHDSAHPSALYVPLGRMQADR